jgi:lipopolysaccharide export system protein LptA
MTSHRFRPRHLFSLWFALAATWSWTAAQSAQPQRTELAADDLVTTSTDTESRTICTGNVVLTGTNLKISCDRLEVVVARTGDTDATIGTIDGFKYLLASGRVRIVQGDREATCGVAEVLPQEDKVVLKENPVVIDHSTDFITRGSEITLFRGERRLQVKNPEISGPPLQDLGPEAAGALKPATEDEAQP